MIKFSKPWKDGRTLIGFGLSAENLKRLQMGQPIPIALEAFGIKDIDVLIFTGETEAGMAQALADAGLIGPETKIKDDRA